MSRDTGFSTDVIQLVHARSQGDCEVMTRVCMYTASQIHHRRPRGMGGSRLESTNRPSNAVHACARCHMYIESHREWALERGFLLTQSSDPSDEPVHWRLASWVLLRNDGTKQPVGNGDTGPIF